MLLFWLFKHICWLKLCSIIKSILCLFPAVKNPSTTLYLVAGIAQFLSCTPDTNLPVCWRLSGVILHPGPQHCLLSQGLVIKPSSSDAGLYTCETVEMVKGREHRKAVVQYLIEVSSTDISGWQTAVIILSCSVFILICLNVKKLKRIGNYIYSICQERAFHQYGQVNQRHEDHSLQRRVRDSDS